MRFGRLIGAGQAGYVFQNMDQPEHYLKLVALPNKPISEYPTKSLDAARFAVNQQQAELMQRVFETGNAPPSLPRIYSYTEGKITPLIQQQLMESDDLFPWEDPDDLWTMLRDFRPGQRYAVWEMEAIPCLSDTDFCNLYDALPSPAENQDYQQLLRYLLDQGFVVRDIRSPDNYGFRTDGTQVFFDPVVAPWPVSESDRNRDPDRYWSFVSIFGPEIAKVQQTIEDGRYFTWYHGQAVMQSETEEVSETDERIAMPDATPDQWAELFQKWNSDNEDAEFRVWMPTKESEAILELLRTDGMLSWASYPEQSLSLNWWGPDEPTAPQIKFATDLINENWKFFSELFNEYFQDRYYPSYSRSSALARLNNRHEPLWDFIEDFDYTSDSYQIITPLTTFLWNLQYHPEVQQEITDADLGPDYFIEMMYSELSGLQDLTKMCRGNSRIAGQALYRALLSLSQETRRGEYRLFEPRYSIGFWEHFYEEYPNSDALQYAHEAGVEPVGMSWNIRI